MSAKKDVKKVGKTKRGKGTKIMVLIGAERIPFGLDSTSASPHEVTLIEPLLDNPVLRRKPQRLLYNLAADSDPLRVGLRKRGIDLFCPHRSNRTKPLTQDGRKLRRYRKRWKVERTTSWMQDFRRLVSRYEGFAQLACVIITLRQF